MNLKNTIEKTLKSQSTLDNYDNLSTKNVRINNHLKVQIRESNPRSRNMAARERLRQKIQSRQ